MTKGIITFLNHHRHYGCITSESDNASYFFHEKDVVRGSCTGSPIMRSGQVVTFELVDTERGPVANGVNRFGVQLEIADTHLLEPEPSPIVLRGLQECTSELEEYLRRHPLALRELHPGTFENLVVAIFRHEGFETERVSSWNQPDGGVDLIAVRHIQSSSSNIRLAIQCKRWAQSRKISADPIRALAGILDRFRAHAGVVATTGFFSEEAMDETKSFFWRISLRDYNSIVDSLRSLRLIQERAETVTCTSRLRR